MTGRPGKFDLAGDTWGVYGGDSWGPVPCQIGRSISDAVTIATSATLTSALAAFTASTDVGSHVITYELDAAGNATVVDGIVPEDTTIISVESATSVTLSHPALVSSTATIVALSQSDITGFTFAAQIRATAKDTEPLQEVEVTVVDVATGAVAWSMSPTVTAALVAQLKSGSGVWDFEVTDGDGLVSTYIQGRVVAEPDKTRA